MIMAQTVVHDCLSSAIPCERENDAVSVIRAPEQEVAAPHNDTWDGKKRAPLPLPVRMLACNPARNSSSHRSFG